MHSFAVTESSEIAAARRHVAALASACGFNEEDVARAALVATEIGTNIVKHGGGGELVAQRLDDDGRSGVGLIGLDKGAGMTDVGQCLRDGFSTGGSPGTGLGAIKRLSQQFDVYSQPDKGTVIVAQLWPQRREPRASTLEFGAIVVPKSGETACGDSWCYSERPEGVLVMGVDGLGHGLGAAQAASTACQVFESEKSRAPGDILHGIHAALRSTRGAAVILLAVDWQQRQLVAVGLGNMVAAIADDQGVKRIASQNGIVGHATPRIRELSYTVEPHSIVLLHSDGLTSSWQLERYPGLLRRHAAIIAGVLYRDCKRGRDDSLIVVLKRAANP